MSDAWFETVAEAQRRAKRRLPRSVYKALIAGSERGLTLHDNQRAFAELGFAPHMADLPTERDLSTTVMGQELSMPVMISPTGVQAVHSSAEIGVAAAAANRGITMALRRLRLQADRGGHPPPTRARSSRATGSAPTRRSSRASTGPRTPARSASIATLDWSFSNGRDWGSPFIPSDINFEAVRKLGVDVALHPRWLMDFAKTGALPDLAAPNMVPLGQTPPKFFEAYGQWNEHAVADLR